MARWISLANISHTYELVDDLAARRYDLPVQPTITAYSVPAANNRDALRKTIKLIAKGIVAGSRYQPLRLHAAQVATTAPRKDYAGQVRAVYDDFVNRWRYVRDPRGLETVTVSGPAIWNLTMGRASPTGLGHGDCDDATVAIGALATALGLPVRIVTMASPGRSLPNHVYPEIEIPGIGWVPADPVGEPKHGLGYHPPASSRQRWDLNGQSVRTLGGNEMQEQWQGYGLESVGLAGTDNAEPESWSENILSFGDYADTYGISESYGLLAEVVDDDIDGYGLARTPMLELSLGDYQYLQEHRKPYAGMVALGDDGATYQWQEGLDGFGFFKKIFKAAKGLKKKFESKAEKLLKKLPGGKYLVKLHKKLHKVTMKLVKPLSKYVGKYAAKLAPVAAFIPGYGPAIAAALYTAGKVAKLINKYGIKQSKKGKLKFKSGKQAKKFKSALKRAAKKERTKRKKKKGKKAKLKKAAAMKKLIAKIRREERARYAATGQRPAAARPRVLKAGSPPWARKIKRIGARPRA